MGSSKKLDGKVAMVTASTDGIGLAVAERLASDGASVMVSSRKQKNVDVAVARLRGQGLKVAGCVCHVAIKEQRTKMIEKTVAEFGGVDILVNNAAVNPAFGQILDISENVWDKIFEVNLKAAFFLTKEVVPLMEKRGGGSVIFVSSQAGYSPSQNIGVYSISKTAMLGLTKALVPQLSRSNIRVNGIAPSIILTKMSEAFMGPYSISKTAMLGMVKALVPQLAKSSIRVNGIAPSVIKTRFSEPLWNNEMSDGFKKTIPLGRFGTSDKCAGAVTFLASDDASYITGETIIINGGLPSRL